MNWVDDRYNTSGVRLVRNGATDGTRAAHLSKLVASCSDDVLSADEMKMMARHGTQAKQHLEFKKQTVDCSPYKQTSITRPSNETDAAYNNEQIVLEPISDDDDDDDDSGQYEYEEIILEEEDEHEDDEIIEEILLDDDFTVYEYYEEEVIEEDDEDEYTEVEVLSDLEEEIAEEDTDDINDE